MKKILAFIGTDLVVGQNPSPIQRTTSADKIAYDLSAFKWADLSGIGLAENINIFDELPQFSCEGFMLKLLKPIRQRVEMGAFRGRYLETNGSRMLSLYTEGLTACTALGLWYMNRENAVKAIELVHFNSDYNVRFQSNWAVYGGGPEKLSEIASHVDNFYKVRAVLFSSNENSPQDIFDIADDIFCTHLEGRIPPEDVIVYRSEKKAAIDAYLTATGYFGESFEQKKSSLIGAFRSLLRDTNKRDSNGLLEDTRKSKGWLKGTHKRTSKSLLDPPNELSQVILTI